jgi:hypothetical protein
LVKIKKRSEDFDKEKIKVSVKKAGASEETAAKVADKIAGKVKRGATTVLIRRWVLVELTPLDAKAADSYKNYKKPTRKP